MTARSAPKVERLGDRGLLVRLGSHPSRELTALLAGLARAVHELDGVVDASPGQTTVLVETGAGAAEAVTKDLPALAAEAEPYEGKLYEVEVHYDGEDVEWACDHLGIEHPELVARHSREPYDVRLLGSPGFIYLSEVPQSIALPRLENPREHVPEGSVGIAGRQTGIYGRPRPGGWRLLARAVEVPGVVPGDRIQFRPL